jgi:hypothetical protein
MRALCAARASRRSSGRAYPAISRSRGLSVGYRTAVTSVILPPSTVTRTWTGPQRVGTVSPVTDASGGGAGRGLSIVAAVAEAHGGR